MRLADSNPSKRQYCYPQCRDPWFNECADCWQSGGNPAIGVKADEPKPPTDSNPSKRSQGGDAQCIHSTPLVGDQAPVNSRGLSDQNPSKRRPL